MIVDWNQNKYDLEFSTGEIKGFVKRLTNQMWKLIPMRENGEDWEKQLDTVILEIVGLNEILCMDSLILQLLSKLEGLKIKKDEIGFDFYRKTIFECINILQEIK